MPLHARFSQKLKLCLVTHMPEGSFEHYRHFILQAVAGGVTSIQLRDKQASTKELQALAQALKTVLTPLHIPLIINDHVCVAKAIDADGVHLGQTDMTPKAARDLLGPDKWIGLSIETYEELAIANQLTTIDYIGASAVFPSQTKPNCKTIWGLDGLRTLTAQSTHSVVAIGGITALNVQQTMACGVCGVAVVSAIQGQANPKLAAQTLIQSMQEEKHVSDDCSTY